MATVEAKAKLRKDIADRISKLSPDEIQRQSKIVYEKLINLPVFKSSKRVSIYLSTSTEIDTEPIVRKIFEDQKKCYVPRCWRVDLDDPNVWYSKAGMQMVRLQSMEDWETLPMTKWNIKQPALKEAREDAIESGGLDLVICPGVAFTKNGDRTGHGGGYYDRYLSKLQQIQEKPPATIAVAFKEQIVDSIPVTSTDITIDSVLFAE